MRNIACVLILLFGISQVQSKEKITLKQIIEQVQTKVKQSKSISYYANYYGKGALAGMVPQNKVTVKMSPIFGEGGTSYRKLLIDGEQIKGNQKSSLCIVGNQEEVQAINHKTKTIWRCPVYRGAETLFNSQLLFPIYGIDDLSSAITGGELDEVNLKGKKVYRISYASPTGYLFRFYINPQDYLVYQIEATKPEFGSWQGGWIVMELNAHQYSLHTANPSEFEVKGMKHYTQKEYSGNFPSIGEQAPDWVLDRYDGGKQALADLKGKVVVLDFWATWCLPCIKGIASMERIHQKYKKQQVAVLGVTYQEKRDPMVMLAKKGGTYPQLNGDALADSYNLKQSGLPIVYIIDKEGRLVDFIMGKTEIDKRLESIIEKALKYN